VNILVDDTLLNKAAIIERCIRRVREEYAMCPGLDNYTNVDASIMNIERACQAAIDMANHIIALNHLGIPQSSANSFELLAQASFIGKHILKSMKAMTGFRNIAVHEYQEIKVDILKYISEQGYKDFILFCCEFGIIIKEG
jgi:uncharacterized protein YutE (UPF0331/DUF86 family)